MTSVSGTGDLSTWTDAHGLSGLAGADEVCRTRAATASIAHAQDYIALLSDSNNDAYCRLHGAGGRVSANSCNSAVLPTGAGPWYRMDDLAAMDVAQNSQLLAPPAGYVPRHTLYNEFGVAFVWNQPGNAFAFTATRPDGVLTAASQTCGDWTRGSADPSNIPLAIAFGGYGGVWSGLGTCDHASHLVCLQQGVHGAPLPRPHPHTARVAFITSAAGSGALGSWADAGGASGVAAGDNICRAHATRAHLPLAGTFKAWLASPTQGSAQAHLQFDGHWYRTDSVRISASIAGLASGELEAPLQLDESGTPTDRINTWTGTVFDGQPSPATCAGWTDGSASAAGAYGASWMADAQWTAPPVSFYFGCTNPMHLYCLGDNDSIFFDGLE